MLKQNGRSDPGVCRRQHKLAVSPMVSACHRTYRTIIDYSGIRVLRMVARKRPGWPSRHYWTSCPSCTTRALQGRAGHRSPGGRGGHIPEYTLRAPLSGPIRDYPLETVRGTARAGSAFCLFWPEPSDGSLLITIIASRCNQCPGGWSTVPDIARGRPLMATFHVHFAHCTSLLCQHGGDRAEWPGAPRPDHGTPHVKEHSANAPTGPVHGVCTDMHNCR